MTEIVAECQSLSRAFITAAEVVYALREVELTVTAGSFVCLHGPSGCGKTTLINVLAGLDEPTSGTVTVLGQRLEMLTDRERANLRLRRLGVVFQEHNLIPEYTAAENVMLPLQGLGVGRADSARQAAEALEKVGLGGLDDRRPDQLSGGQRQRVGIARALVGQRSLLLADEPTGALDSANSRSLFELISTLCEGGLTAIVASHDPQALHLAARTVELADGRVVG